MSPLLRLVITKRSIQQENFLVNNKQAAKFFGGLFVIDFYERWAMDQ